MVMRGAGKGEERVGGWRKRCVVGVGALAGREREQGRGKDTHARHAEIPEAFADCMLLCCCRLLLPVCLSAWDLQVVGAACQTAD